ncbi:MAG: Rpn family recombination-promoting nuclease/putative transposase [Leptonema sp. (in: Bacteria)]|nr:Rpn family recombination-promoting nuclease/putative transposase [Leptonema sp. (in: bacteria)]
MNDNNNNIIPHANFAASVFSNLTYARQILKPLLPIEVSKNIDWKTLKLTNSSFVDAPHLFNT